MEHAAHQLGKLAVTQVGWLWLIPLFPLVGATINATCGWWLQKKLGKKVNHLIAVGMMALAFFVALAAFVKMMGMDGEHRFLQDTLWNMLTAGRVTVDLGFSLDPLSMMMVLIITFIGMLIHVFSIGYMADEPAYWRFFSYLNLFVFSMLLLVMGDNFVLMFFGWEGVGLCSYLLISFWYTDPDKAAAGMKAFVANRFGDFGFILGLFLLFWGLGGVWSPRDDIRSNDYRATPGLNAFTGARTAAESDKLAPRIPLDPAPGEGGHGAAAESVPIGPTLNFRELRDQVVIEKTHVAERLRGMTVWGFGLVALICILMFVGAMGKSAQIPLYVWLPDAMAGPTPVSALIHAATMVTAGVYMVARLNFLFAMSPSAMGWVASIGALTALFAASIGFFQYDIKKVLAYSTVSQLGFMFIGVGVGAYWAGTYHLLTHAFFKATLFLCSGSVILGCHHEQDMRKMGGLQKHMPITRWAYLVACWAIAGFPWASGFYSKDEILWKAFSSEHLFFLGTPTPWLGKLIYLVGIVTATGTSFYMFRSYYMTFSGEYRGAGGHDDPGAHGAGHDDHGHHGGTPKESPRSITVVLVTLAAGSVAMLFLGIPAAWFGSGPALEHWLEPALSAQVPFKEYGHGMEYLFQAIGVGAGAVGWVLARMLYKDAKSGVPADTKKKWFNVWTVVYNKYYVDEGYRAAVIRPAVFFAKALSWFDGHILDWLVNLAGWVTRFVANIDGAIDKYLVDGAVNLVANGTVAFGRRLRRIQTGHIQTYLYGALAGALAFVALNYLISR
jgi:NADH-quinone oxidoreductase subunit L